MSKLIVKIGGLYVTQAYKKGRGKCLEFNTGSQGYENLDREEVEWLASSLNNWLQNLEEETKGWTE